MFYYIYCLTPNTRLNSHFLDEIGKEHDLEKAKQKAIKYSEEHNILTEIYDNKNNLVWQFIS